MNSKIKLIATPLSHYARKVRILLDLYSLPYEFIDIGNIATVRLPHEAGNNPVMKVLLLQHDTDWLIESDHISSYIVKKYDNKYDKYQVNSPLTVCDMNTRAILNGIMVEEVKVIMAGRMQVPTQDYSYFQKARQAVDHGLNWLEVNHLKFDSSKVIDELKYKEFHLVCCWDHLQYYDFIPNMTKKYPRLSEIVERVSENEIVCQSAPHVVKPKTTTTNV